MEHLDTLGKSVGELLCEAYVKGYREALKYDHMVTPSDEEIRASFHEWMIT